MLHSLKLAAALAFAAPGFLLPAQASDRTLPMRFDLRQQGPADACAPKCQTWISASGAITSDSGRDFSLFAKDRDLSNATVVLDSDGGSVLGAIGLGREIRRLGLATTGRPSCRCGRRRPGNARRRAGCAARPCGRATLSPRGDCESMCAFVLLGGVHRAVPAEARVMVHQIWLGDRRDDPTAANYSAEDLVLVAARHRTAGAIHRRNGRLHRLLGLALRIPPWEPMHSMTAEELRDTKLANGETETPAGSTVAASPAASGSQPVPRATSGLRASPISERHWSMIDRAGAAALARHHPLTVEGEEIGSFDLAVACGAGTSSYDVSYSERRHGGDRAVLPAGLGMVTLRVGGTLTSLKVASSERRHEPDELVTYAAGTVPASLIGAFAFQRQSFGGDRDREQGHRYGDPARQHRRATQSAAAGGELRQGARRSRRIGAGQKDRRLGCRAVGHFHYRFMSRCHLAAMRAMSWYVHIAAVDRGLNNAISTGALI